MCIRTFFVTTSFLLTMKVSIIVPVFRTERTLTRCVESLQAQTFTQWELILVDDGSDDGAPALCDRMAATDARIRVIHQVNAGLSAARNAGLKVAQGKYVWFIDSDDYVATDTLAAAVNAMETSAVELSFVEFPVAVKWGHPTQHTVALVAETYTDKWKWWFGAEGYKHCYACNKLYRREAIDNIRFEKRVFEDAFFILPVLNTNKPFATITKGMYYYCYNAEGITESPSANLLDLLEAHVRVFRQLRWACPKQIGKSQFAAYYAEVLNVQIDVYRRFNHRVLLKRQSVGGTPKLWLQRLLGVRLCCFIVNLLRK